VLIAVYVDPRALRWLIGVAGAVVIVGVGVLLS
jgi:hypothetical protein